MGRGCAGVGGDRRPSTGSFIECLQQLGLHQSNDGKPELHPGPRCGAKDWAITCCSLGCLGRKCAGKRSSTDVYCHWGTQCEFPKRRLSQLCTALHSATKCILKQPKGKKWSKLCFSKNRNNKPQIWFKRISFHHEPSNWSKSKNIWNLNINFQMLKFNIFFTEEN